MRVPLYRQLESSDCGPACIRMVSAYYGKAYRMKTLKALSEVLPCVSVADSFETSMGLLSVELTLPLTTIG